VDVFIGGGVFGSSQRATRSSIEMEAAHVSEILSTPGVTSYLSIHCRLLVFLSSKGSSCYILSLPQKV